MSESEKFAGLQSGSAVNHYCLVQKVESKTTRNGKEYLDLMLSDSSGSLNAKWWDGFQTAAEGLRAGTVVFVNGIVNEFAGSLQIKINTARIADASDNVSPSEFLPHSKRKLSEMLNELYERIDGINNGHLKAVVQKLLEKERLLKYQTAPAGKAWHHSYIHGLIEHTLEIIRICDLMCDIHPELDRDLLASGAVLHDYGKIFELSYDSAFDYTTKGKLLGHIVIAAMEIEKAAAQIPDFPEETKQRLIHLVLSHQGKLEFATPVEPRMIEAIVLYHADELSAKTNAYKNAVLRESGSGADWTKFIQLAGTQLYIPDELKQKNQ